MKEIVITNEIREKVNNYLGFELIKQNEVGHHLYDEAPGLGRIGIEGTEVERVVTNKQLDSNGNIEWFKTPHPKARPGEVRPFHCKLATVSAKKAKILIASLFPEEAVDNSFLQENRESIEELRKQLKAVNLKMKERENPTAQKQWAREYKLLLGPNEILLDSALYLIFGKEEETERPVMLFGPNNHLM